MDTILHTLQNKRRQAGIKRHPLYMLSEEEKKTYVFGLAILAKGNIKVIKELEVPFFSIVQMLGFNETVAQESIVEINNHFDIKFSDFIHFISKEYRFRECFLIDLLQLSRKSCWGKEYCAEVVHQFRCLLSIGDHLFHFLENFIEQAEQGDLAALHRSYDAFLQQGERMDLRLLSYICPAFTMQKQYAQLRLDNGGIHWIENDTVVTGDIIVSNGTRLLIDQAEIKIGGKILVQDGQVLISNSKLIAIGNPREEYLIQAQTHTLHITQSALDLQHLCYGIVQTEGILALSHVKIEHAADSYAVCVTGEACLAEQCLFEDCSGGAVKCSQDCSVQLRQCNFTQCRAAHGGAVHVSTRNKVLIEDCAFQNCTAAFLGAAVYFKHKRYGQQVQNCRSCLCEPEENIIFNVYESQIK